MILDHHNQDYNGRNSSAQKKSGPAVFGSKTPDDPPWSDLIDQLTPEIEELHEGFRIWTQSIESKFVALGQSMGSSLRVTSQLSKDSIQRLDAVNAVFSSSQMSGHIHFAETKMKSWIKRCQHDYAILETIPQNLEIVVSSCREILKQAAFLSRCGTLVAIQSSRSSECASVSSGFGLEMKQLTQRISLLTEEILEDAKKTQVTAQEALVKIRSQLEIEKQLQDDSLIIEKKTDSAIAQMMQKCHAAIEENRNQLNTLAQSAQDGIFHLQFGDIVRQKCEHVQLALLDALKLGQSVFEQEDSDYSSTLQSVYHILRLQREQMELIKDELLNASAKLSQVFNKLDAGLRTFAQTSSDIDTQTIHTIPLAQLSELIRELSLEKDKGKNLSDQAVFMSQETARSAQQLSEHGESIRHITGELHLQALNATVMSYNLGTAGRSLVVLANEVSTIRSDVSAAADNMLEALKAMLIRIQNLKTEQNSEGEFDSMTDLVAEVTQMEREFDSAMNQISRSAKTQITTLQSAQSILDKLEEMTAEIEIKQRKISELLSWLSDYKIQASQAGQQIDHTLYARYTMECQREIHRKVQESDTPSKNTGTLCPTTALVQSEPDEIGDNVELF